MASANSTNQTNDVTLPKPVSEITKPTPTSAAAGVQNGLPALQKGQADTALEELAPAFIPLDPSLIGVLPNGVHVSRMASYSHKVQAALRKVLPTATDAIKAYNLTAQLTLQYMLNLKNKSAQLQSRPILPRVLPLFPVIRADQVNLPPSTSAAPRIQFEQPASPPSVPSSSVTPLRAEQPSKPLLSSVACTISGFSNPAKEDPLKGSTNKVSKVESAESTKLKEVVNSLSTPELSGSEPSQCARLLPYKYTMEKQLSKLQKLGFRSKKKVTPRSYKTVETSLSSKQKTSLKQPEQSFKQKRADKGFDQKKSATGKRQRISSREMDISHVLENARASKAKKLKVAAMETDPTPNESISDKTPKEHKKKRRRKQIISPLVDAAFFEKTNPRSNHPPKSYPSRKRPSPDSGVSAAISKKPRMHGGSVPIEHGFVKRMASLNARACVTAMMEPERRPLLKPKSSSSKPPLKKPITTSLSSLAENEAVLNKIAKTGAGGQYVAIHHPTEEYVPQFNTLGLLYNGATIHPTATRVFYSTGNTDLVLPKLVLPLLVPSSVNTVGYEVEKVRDIPVTRKLPKSNNGWRAMGSPIKVIEYTQNDVTVTRKYYIGIQRKKDSVFVRDCVMLRSSSEEKPYIGKIASIWRENDGIMMTLFWYYRPEEVDKAATVGTQFRENELLASQHYDVNSVACIEDKCHILGLKQYCRYHAAVVRGHSQPLMGKVPPLPSRDSGSTYVSHVTDHVKSHDQKAYFDLGSHMEEIVSSDPSLVYLCYRGYNHVNGRIY